MKTIWKLFTGDVRRLTSNIVSIIIVIGLIVIPGLFTWFNVAASWDPFSNTKNLKFAIANTDKGYKSDLIPVRISVGDQVVNELRANSQLDWTFTDESDAIDGTKSGKYYASVVIPSDFSQKMVTFFSTDAQHAKLNYYTNEKTNALAPKLTGQGADQVSAQINEMFAKTITETALSIASDLVDQINKPTAQDQLANFTGNINGFADNLNQTADLLNTFSNMSDSAQGLITSSNELAKTLSANAKTSGNTLQQARSGATNVISALNNTSDTLSSALSQSSASYEAVGNSINSTLNSANNSVNDVESSIRHQSDLVNQQADHYQQIRDAIAQLPDSTTVPGRNGTNATDESPSINVKPTKDAILHEIDTVIAQLRALSASLNAASDNLANKQKERNNEVHQTQQLVRDAKASINNVKKDFDSKLKPDLDSIISSIKTSSSILDQSASQLNNTLQDISSTSDKNQENISSVHQTLSSTASLMNKTSSKLREFSSKLTLALSSGNMDKVRQLLSHNPEITAATMAAPVKVKRTALFPVENFGTALTPFYTFIPLWVGSLLLAVTLKTTVSRKTRATLGNPKPYQLFLGHYGIFALLSMLQATFSCMGTILFLGVTAVHPWLMMCSAWISALVYSFLIYTLVVSFGNIGKAIGVILLVLQISGSGGAYPLQVLPGFVSNIHPYLPISHSVQAMRASIAGIYMNDFWIEMGKLLLFVPPMLLLGLVLRKLLINFNQWYMSKVESTKLIG